MVKRSVETLMSTINLIIITIVKEWADRWVVIKEWILCWVVTFKIRFDLAKGLGADELLYVLWVFHTTPQIAIEETPFSLVY